MHEQSTDILWVRDQVPESLESPQPASDPPAVTLSYHKMDRHRRQLCQPSNAGACHADSCPGIPNVKYHRHHQPPAPACLAFSRTGCPRDRAMNCMVHALRELTCSGHQVATHEPKAREQVKVKCKALSSELGSIREPWRNPANWGEPEGSEQRDTVGGRGGV